MSADILLFPVHRLSPRRPIPPRGRLAGRRGSGESRAGERLRAVGSPAAEAPRPPRRPAPPTGGPAPWGRRAEELPPCA